MSLKHTLYRCSSTAIGRFMLRIASQTISVPNLKPSSNSATKKHPFYILITIDTEGGYVDKNERRVWQKEALGAYEGYYAGIHNLRHVLTKHKTIATFFLNTHGFSAKGNEYKKIITELRALIAQGHEIGLHPHPDSDSTIQQKLNKSFPATSCFFYNEIELKKILRASKALIQEHLGKSVSQDITSIRWGNWALNTNGAKAIASVGLTKDSSATPGLKGHLNDSRKYDWETVQEHYPWLLSTSNYLNTSNQKSKVQEIPIATFSVVGHTLRADPLYSELLKKAFLFYYKNADRSKKPFPFVLMTHSSEATNREGKHTQVLKDLDDFISFAKKYNDVKFVAMKDV